MKIKFSPLLQQEILHLNKKDKKLVTRIEKQIKLFESNPKHPSLRTHKLTGKIGNRWSISINRSLRMVYIVIEDQQKGESTAYFVALGTHNQVYKN